MTSYNFEDFALLKNDFPDLYYDKKHNVVKGELSFSAHYENKGKKGKEKWIIFPCSSNDDCLHGYYEIEISLSTDSPTVREIGNKIINLAKKLKKLKEDLHIYSNSDICCLGWNISKTLPLSKFIVNWVYPYFVWQAYFEKYEKVPPWGEYSHDKETARKEYANDIKNRGVNHICPCGSGKKYKKCCKVKR